ncbi:MAG: dockerin type I repeat-containing protein [Planctomycetes bacterium]|nr:dockerin type I repeat-containing protein [Planctomycetota bacterium]
MTFLRALPVVGLVLALPQLASAQVDTLLWASEDSGAIGDLVEIGISIDNPSESIDGYSYGVCHDPRVAAVAGVEWGGSSDVPPFHQVNIFPTGWTVGAIVAIHGAPGMPPGIAQLTDVATYEISGPGTTELEFCGGLGTPPIPIELVSSGMSIPTLTANGSLTGWVNLFTRGDCNGDGGLDIADSIFVEQYLFLGGADPVCLTACDTNDDGQVDIADSIYGLNYLFVGGPQPIAPFPFCGTDPASTLDCGMSCP